MKKNNTYAWLFWTILILGLAIVGCSNGDPAVPDPTDVQDFGFEEGGGIDQKEVSELVTAYEALMELGGGVADVVDDSGYTMVGAIDRLSGASLHSILVEVNMNDGTQILNEFDERCFFTDADLPIAVTVSCPGYITKTIAGSSANVFAFGMDRVSYFDEPCFITGYAYESSPISFTKPWLVQAKSTHINREWEESTGLAYTTPSTWMWANPYQSVGGTAFLFELTDPESGPIPEGLVEDYDLIGYSYSHIGTLYPGAVGAWIMNLNEEGSGTVYEEGNYTVNYEIPGVPETSGKFKITPGGIKDDSEEFISYFPWTSCNAVLAGSYELTSFSPPVLTDRDVVHFNFEYLDGATETRFVPWDPSGAGGPNVVFGLPPGFTKSVIEQGQSVEPFFLPYMKLTFEWNNTLAEGLQVLSLNDQWGITRWEVVLANDLTNLDTVEVPIPVHLDYLTFETTITRIECPGIELDNYDNHTIWTDTTAWLTSAPVTAMPLPTDLNQ